MQTLQNKITWSLQIISQAYLLDFRIRWWLYWPTFLHILPRRRLWPRFAPLSLQETNYKNGIKMKMIELLRNHSWEIIGHYNSDNIRHHLLRCNKCELFVNIRRCPNIKTWVAGSPYFYFEPSDPAISELHCKYRIIKQALGWWYYHHTKYYELTCGGKLTNALIAHTSCFVYNANGVD